MVTSNMQPIQPIYASQSPLVVSSIPKSTPNLRQTSTWFIPSFASILAQSPRIFGLEENSRGKLHCSHSPQRRIPFGPMEK